MAKAGFWLRGAKGKLAGAVAQKGQNGTILREIVTPKNPKTEKQIYQRAVMATVMKAYSAGKDIFDHSIQGLERGGKTQQYFIARNAKLLRSLIASELTQVQAGTLQATAAKNCAVAPKSLYAVPGAFMVSEGTYDQVFFTLSNAQTGETTLSIPNAASETETVAQYAQRTGLVPGDIYTIVAFVIGANIVHNGVDMRGQLSDEYGTKQYNSVFAFIRAQVKADVLTSTAVVNTSALTQLFEVTMENNPQINVGSSSTTKAIVSPFDEGATLSDPLLGNNGSVAIIRSRVDEDLRSTSYMKLENGSTDAAFGITTPYILPTWQKGADSLGTSELILESDQQGV